jgi:hypothetical protein
MASAASAKRAKRQVRKRCRKPLTLRTKVVRRHGKRRRVQYCAKPRRRRPLIRPQSPPPVVETPVAPQSPAPPDQTPANPPVIPPPPPIAGAPIPGVPVYSGPFGRRQAERLLWRAGFGPSPGHAEALAAFGVQGAVRSLTQPQVAEALSGPEPVGPKGGPVDPLAGAGNEHLWWLDRMARTNTPFVERATLIWHDWFATANTELVNSVTHMLGQNEMFRRDGRGSFAQLLENVASDPAMLRWLNGLGNKVGKPDENYARESMELFSLGADRGAYTEQDVRELARAHTGWVADHSDTIGWHNFRVEPRFQDRGQKTVFGQTGNFNWRDASRLCVEHPKHPSYVVEKLWHCFIPTPPDAATKQAMEDAYKAGSYRLLPVFEAILMHPDLYEGESMVKSPVVFAAGLARARGAAVRGAMLTWCEMAGQRLFMPPNVDGWNQDAWLDTTAIRARWMLVYYVLKDSLIVGDAMTSYDHAETPQQAVSRALAFWCDPPFSSDSRAALEQWAATCMPLPRDQQEAASIRAIRQNALRHLIGASPDFQVC